MNILVLNGGSSSIKFSMFASTRADDAPDLLLEGELSGIGTSDTTLSVNQAGRPQASSPVQAADTSSATIGLVLDAIHKAELSPAGAVGYRVVHPGAEIDDHVRITDQVLDKLGKAASFAPLHDPQAVEMIRETMRRMPDVPHFACFDTVFHRTMPEEASTYPVPKQYRDAGVKRYGFHGLSCESVVRQMTKVAPFPERAVIAHLGSGCSVTALIGGKSIDTTMGLTPTGGIVMGTRPGDLDPGLMLYLLRQHRGEHALGDAETMFNHHAGMVALSGLPNDMKAIRHAAAGEDTAARLALKIFTRSVRKAVGGFAWLMGGLDALIFTGGIGQHDAATRAEVLHGTQVLLDASLNGANAKGVWQMNASHSPTAVFAVPAEEDLVIALHVKRMLQADA